MCLAPNLIPNPNRGRKDKYSCLVDTQSAYIPVPCGHCTDCVHMRQSSIVQRVQVEQRKNHLFFCSLSYNNESLPVVVTSSGYEIRYAARRDVTLMCKRLKKSNAFGRPWKYLAVQELGSKRGRPHHHILFMVEKYPKDTFGDILNLEKLLFDSVLHEWRRNYGSTRRPVYKPLCTYVRRFVRGKLSSNYDLHYVNDASSQNGMSDVAFYVTKYMFKPSERAERLQQALHLNLSEDEYEDIWKIVRPGMTASPGLGLADTDYVRECIRHSKQTSEFPRFYNPVDGSNFPLSRYYSRKGIYTMEDALFFNSKKTDHEVIPDDRTIRKIDKRDKLNLVIQDHDVFSELLDELEP